jgi:prepilin-type N-terminal cleavage/methylation domain-containing protein
MRDISCKRGFTLVELLLALVVTGILLAALTTLAFAVGSANDTTDDTIQKQMQIRFATLRVSELIRYCKLICTGPNNELAVWREDENDDGQININELVYIERGAGKDYLGLCEFPASDTSIVSLSDVQTILPSNYSVTYVPLVPECADVEFALDTAPPYTKFVNVSFDMTEDAIVGQYEINAALCCWAGNLLDSTGSDIVSDDD